MNDTYRSTLRALGVALALVVTASTPALYAQADSDSIHLRNDCRLATQIIRSGNPANKRDWALGIIAWCGRDGVDAFVSEWKAKEASADSQTAANLRYSVFNVRDGALFEAFLSTAQSPSSSARARIEAWYYLFNQVGPGIDLSETELFSDSIRHFCVFDFSTSNRPVVVGPLPGDFVSRVDAAAVQVSASGTDQRIRRFGKCVHDYVTSRARVAP